MTAIDDATCPIAIQAALRSDAQVWPTASHIISRPDSSTWSHVP